MSNLKDDVAAHHALAKRFGASLPRSRLSTEEAVSLALELDPATLRHAVPTIASAKAFAALAADDRPTDRAALTAHLNLMAKHEEAFWNAFHGEPYAGGEIVRRRA